MAIKLNDDGCKDLILGILKFAAQDLLRADIAEYVLKETLEFIYSEDCKQYCEAVNINYRGYLKSCIKAYNNKFGYELKV